MPGNKQSVEIITKRRKVLSGIIEEMATQNILPTTKLLLSKLTIEGFKITRWTIQEDRKAINKDSTWIEDLGESNYSAYMEDIYSKLLWIENEAQKMYAANWLRRSIHRKVLGGRIKQTKTGVEVVGGKEVLHDIKIEDNIAQPKFMFLSIYLKAQELKVEMVKGENIQLATAMLSRKLDNYKEELDLVKIERDKAKAEVAKLKE